MNYKYCPHCGNLIEASSACCASEAEPKIVDYDKEIALARSLAIRGRYETAKAILEMLITEAPEDLRCYMGLVRIATQNYTAYEGDAIEDSIRVARQMADGVSLEEFDADYASYATRRKEYFEKKKNARKPEEKPYKVVNTTLVEYNGHERFVVVSAGCEKILSRAFYQNKDLLDIDLPDGLHIIGDHAFNGCDALTNLPIPNSVTFIGNYAFYGCKSLTNLFVPNSVTFIGTHAFGSCESLTNLRLSKSVSYIGVYAFAHCKSLREITFNGTMAEWAKIKKENLWNYETPLFKVVHCTDGDCQP